MFVQELNDRIEAKKTLLCMGLDPTWETCPVDPRDDWKAFSSMMHVMVDIGSDHAACMKPNLGYFVQFGERGITLLRDLALKAEATGLPCILDAKPGDGGGSAKMYAESYIGERQFAPFSALTVETSIADPGWNEYVQVANTTGRGLFLVVRTSFNKPPSRIENIVDQNGSPVWHHYARMVYEAASDSAVDARGYSPIGAVVGATQPEDAARARELMPDSIFLVPGYGSQGAGAHDALAGLSTVGNGVIVNSSSAIMKAWMQLDPAASIDDKMDAIELAACASKDELNVALHARS